MRASIVLGLLGLLTACGPLQRPLDKDCAEITAKAVLPVGATPETGEGDGRKAAFPNTIVVYSEAGLNGEDFQQWTIYHTGRILASDGEETQAGSTRVDFLFETVEATGFWALAESYGPLGGCPDYVVRTLTVYREGQIKQITVIGDPDGLPALLAHALSELKLLLTNG